MTKASLFLSEFPGQPTILRLNLPGVDIDCQTPSAINLESEIPEKVDPVALLGRIKALLEQGIDFDP